MPKERARDLGIPFEGRPGFYNAITDVPGVEVGFSTVLEGEPSENTDTSEAFARTGVTAILPRGHRRSAVFAGRHDFNGNGELTGTHWIDDSGFLHGPLLITNTNSVGICRDTAAKWMLRHDFFYPSYVDGREVPGYGFFYPAVGETFDGTLNNINGFRIREEHVLEALDSAAGGAVAEGNVGGGTGMRCFNFKGGTGTSSRTVVIEEVGSFTVGVLVQANFGAREDFMIRGIPVGRMICDCEERIVSLAAGRGEGSIIAVAATDAPLLPWQLSKLSRRISLGIGMLGGGCQNGSGDIFLAFSTANEGAFCRTVTSVELLSDGKTDPLYRAAVQAAEEAVLNALCAAESMTGRNMNYTPALPHDQVREIFRNLPAAPGMGS